MGHLPHHRRIIFGRTYSSPWDPASMDPIETYRRPFKHWWYTLPTAGAIVVVALAFVFA